MNRTWIRSRLDARKITMAVAVITSVAIATVLLGKAVPAVVVITATFHEGMAIAVATLVGQER